MSEREQNGRFGKGNQIAKKENGGNGGRLPRPKEDHLLDLLDKAVPDEVMIKMLASGAARAMAGDVAWAKLLLGYKFGLPIQRTEVSGPEGGPVAIGYNLDSDTIAEALRILGGGNGCQGCGSA